MIREGRKTLAELLAKELPDDRIAIAIRQELGRGSHRNSMRTQHPES